MAHPRQVKALGMQLAVGLTMTKRQPGEDEGDWLYRVAARMIDDGPSCLVPGALTDAEAASFPFDGEFLSISEKDRAEAATERREALIRLARGEETT